jgi:DNA-binding HxlR family transcriptional regulator
MVTRAAGASAKPGVVPPAPRATAKRTVARAKATSTEPTPRMMRGKQIEPAPLKENSIAAAVGLIADEWTLLILLLAFQGVRRFNEWKERLGIANSVLTERLRRLVERDILVKLPYQDRPVRSEYYLTDAGKDLWRVLISIWSWESQWVTTHREPIPDVVHIACGEKLALEMHCSSCGEVATSRQVRGVLGPGQTIERSVPQVTTRRRSIPSGGDGRDSAAGPGLFPQTITLIGNRWSVAILASAFFGTRRFTDFLRQLNAPPTIISERLRSFCDVGVLEPTTSSGGSRRVEYKLTDKGRAFFPKLMTTIDWGQQWIPDPDGPAITLTHITCGKTFHPLLVCGWCEQTLDRRDLHIDEIGPVRARANQRRSNPTTQNGRVLWHGVAGGTVPEGGKAATKRTRSVTRGRSTATRGKQKGN